MKYATKKTDMSAHRAATVERATLRQYLKGREKQATNPEVKAELALGVEWINKRIERFKKKFGGL